LNCQYPQLPSSRHHRLQYPSYYDMHRIQHRIQCICQALLLRKTPRALYHGPLQECRARAVDSRAPPWKDPIIHICAPVRIEETKNQQYGRTRVWIIFESNHIRYDTIRHRSDSSTLIIAACVGVSQTVELSKKQIDRTSLSPNPEQGGGR